MKLAIYVLTLRTSYTNFVAQLVHVDIISLSKIVIFMILLIENGQHK